MTKTKIPTFWHGYAQRGLPHSLHDINPTYQGRAIWTAMAWNRKERAYLESGGTIPVAHHHRTCLCTTFNLTKSDGCLPSRLSYSENRNTVFLWICIFTDFRLWAIELWTLRGLWWWKRERLKFSRSATLKISFTADILIRGSAVLGGFQGLLTGSELVDFCRDEDFREVSL